MVENKTITSKIRVVFIYIIVIILGIICLFPLLNMVAVSFSGPFALAANQVGIIPVDFTTEAYEKILGDVKFWRAFLNSVIRVVTVLVTNVSVTLLMAYPLSRSKERFRFRNFFMYLLIFAMLFSGGMVPSYMLMRKLNLLNSLWALILPGIVTPFNIILVMNFFRELPQAMEEAAIIDGAGPFQILTQIFVPCSKPSVATIALFAIVDNWNEFQNGLIYQTKAEFYPVMTYINLLNVNMEAMLAASQGGNNTEMLAAMVESGISQKGLNAAKIMIAVVPLLVIYPLLQKYLITGIVMGSVKE